MMFDNLNESEINLIYRMAKLLKTEMATSWADTSSAFKHHMREIAKNPKRDEMVNIAAILTMDEIEEYFNVD